MQSPADYDLTSGNSWGRSLYAHAKHKDGSWLVGGCLTPIPTPGQTAKFPDGKLWRFRSVEPWGNPRDGFNAVVERV
jgi:hypothetical protein